MTFTPVIFMVVFSLVHVHACIRSCKTTTTTDTQPECPACIPPTTAPEPARVAPVLQQPPSVDHVDKFRVDISWAYAFDGDGPVVRYAVNVRSEGQRSWKTFGIVSGSSRTFSVDRLQPDTPYEVMVSIATDDPDRSEAPGPIAFTRTLQLVSPRLLDAPSIFGVGTSYFSLRWTRWFDGDGPVSGYNIRTKPRTGPGRAWSSAGFVSVASGATQMNVTGLQHNTSYDVEVSLVHCHDGASDRNPTITRVKTLALDIPTLRTPPVFSEIGTTYFVVQWRADFEGHGPVNGYAIKVRVPMETEWTYVSIVPVSRESPVEFSVTERSPDTTYEAQVSLLYSSLGGGESEGPVRRVKTLGSAPDSGPTDDPAPQCVPPSEPAVTGERRRRKGQFSGTSLWIIIPPYVVCILLIIINVSYCIYKNRRRVPAVDSEVQDDEVAEKREENNARALVPCQDDMDVF